jgi:hypothetical protein
MKQGDLVEYQGKRWVVQKYDPRRTRTATLANCSENSGVSFEVPHDLDRDPKELRVVSNPMTEWPFFVPPEKPRFGELLEVSLIKGMEGQPLQPYYDWVLIGHSVFFRPDLNPRLGDVFFCTYAKGSQRVLVNKSVGTMKQRTTKKVRVKKQPKTAYDHLLADDDDEV